MAFPPEIKVLAKATLPTVGPETVPPPQIKALAKAAEVSQILAEIRGGHADGDEATEMEDFHLKEVKGHPHTHAPTHPRTQTAAAAMVVCRTSNHFAVPR